MRAMLLAERYAGVRTTLLHAKKGDAMPKERLRQLLRELHDELERTNSVEPDSRQLLTGVMWDLQEILERSDEEALDGAGTFGDTLRDATLQFEGEHPTLAALLGRVVDALSQIGI